MGWLRKHAGTSLGGSVIGLATGGLAGALIGGQVGGQVEQERKARELLKQQEALARGELEQNKANIAKVRALYGVLPEGDPKDETFQKNLSNAVEKRAGFESNIEGGLAAAREEATGANLANLQQTAQQGRMSAARSGLAGSSQDIGNRRMLLGSYIQGRGNVVRGLAAGPSAGWNALTNERLGLESQARSMGSTPMDSVMAAQRGLGAIQSAKANIVPGTFYDTLGTTAALGAQGIQLGAQGATGLRGLGGSNNGVFTPRKV